MSLWTIQIFYIFLARKTWVKFKQLYELVVYITYVIFFVYLQLKIHLTN